MFRRAFDPSVCASCRLRATIATKQFARTRRPYTLQWQKFPPKSRFLSTSSRLQQEQAVIRDSDDIEPSGSARGADDVHAIIRQHLQPKQASQSFSPEEAARHARETYGSALPDGELSEEEYKIYERLYGAPLKLEELDEEEGGVLLDDGGGTSLLKESEDGQLEEVVFDEADEVGEEGMEEVTEQEDFVASQGDATLAGDINAAFSAETSQPAVYDAEEDPTMANEEESYQRAHPLTIANRFTTSPSTIYLPKHTLVDAISTQLSGISNTHLREAAHRIFGGIGLPYSTSTPARAKTMQPKSIALDAMQSQMSEIEGDVFLATLIPGVYASVTSVLVETRKRLGTAWAQELVKKAQKKELRILDAGGGGAGVLAVRELLRAEWERMHEEDTALGSGMALAEADGKLGGPGASPPLGQATVLTGSETLRKRASRLLENTTFVPRLPDYLHTEEAKKKGKFDLVIAPHTLWPLREDYMRKSHLQNLWGMLSQDGGVMVVLEKGVPRGFELVAGAREMLLETRIASDAVTTSTTEQQEIESDGKDEPLRQAKPRTEETGMIIAPCTNHTSCPMYDPPGRVKGRRNICHFSQRYIRPPFLQTLLGAKDKNFEDVQFSYISIMRGRDLRAEKELGIRQGEEATERAFEGYEGATEQDVHPLSLPRAVLPPLKRRGHVILDLCTPAGTLERWTVPRSFSKQAFRDARKSSWGDLWALGAKTRVPRTPKIKKRKSDADVTVEGNSVRTDNGEGWDVDEYGHIVPAAGVETQATERGDGGRMRTGMVKGLRDRRDKKGDGRGRKKRAAEE